MSPSNIVVVIIVAAAGAGTKLRTDNCYNQEGKKAGISTISRVLVPPSATTTTLLIIILAHIPGFRVIRVGSPSNRSVSFS